MIVFLKGQPSSMEASHYLLILFNTVNPTYTVFCLRKHYFFSWNARVFFNSLDYPSVFSLFDDLSKFSFALKKKISSNQCNLFWLRSPSISAWPPKKRHRSSLDIDAHNHNRTTSRSPLSKKMFTSVKQKRKKNIFLAPMMHQPPLWGLPSSLPAPHHTACGWIAASWRWTWSIRSINRDYCNPRGQEGGTGPRRVHTTHTCRLRANLAKNGKHLATRSCELTFTEWTHQTLFSTLVDTHWNDTRRFRSSAQLMAVFTLTSWVEP